MSGAVDDDEFEGGFFSRPSAYEGASLLSSQVAPVRNEQQKTIHDPIWGYNVHLEPELVRIIDTPQFQRLRDLKQLGTTYMVFPGASHNRFEHCIGTSHLAGQMLNNLRARQPLLGITNKDYILVKVAALCHDLGHGPFSHVFDNEFIPFVLPDTTWKHEDASEMMLEAALDDCGLSHPGDPLYFSPADVEFVKALINPKRHPMLVKALEEAKRGYLLEIVSNERNGVDVDKFDYLSRDSQMIGFKASHDPRRLLTNCKVIDGHICFHQKEAYPLYELFKTRYSLFKQVYSHRVGKAVEYMICDILKMADPVLHISSRIYDANDYITLTDSILKTIEYSKEEELEPARQLCLNLRRRQLYKMAYDELLPVSSYGLGKIKASDIIKYKAEGDTITEDDIVVQNLELNYSKKDENPVDTIDFFKTWDDTESFHLTKDKVSLLIPDRFQEKYLRVFVRYHDRDDITIAARTATLNYLKAVLQREGNPSNTLRFTRGTPSRPPLGSRPSSQHHAQRVASRASTLPASLPGSGAAAAAVGPAPASSRGGLFQLSQQSQYPPAHRLPLSQIPMSQGAVSEGGGDAISQRDVNAPSSSSSSSSSSAAAAAGAGARGAVDGANLGSPSRASTMSLSDISQIAGGSAIAATVGAGPTKRKQPSAAGASSTSAMAAPSAAAASGAAAGTRAGAGSRRRVGLSAVTEDGSDDDVDVDESDDVVEVDVDVAPGAGAKRVARGGGIGIGINNGAQPVKLGSRTGSNAVSGSSTDSLLVPSSQMLPGSNGDAGVSGMGMGVGGPGLSQWGADRTGIVLETQASQSQQPLAGIAPGSQISQADAAPTAKPRKAAAGKGAGAAAGASAVVAESKSVGTPAAAAGKGGQQSLRGFVQQKP